MPRTLRASAADFCYHVLNRGNGRAEVFHKAADYDAFLEMVAAAQKRLPMRVLAREKGTFYFSRSVAKSRMSPFPVPFPVPQHQVALEWRDTCSPRQLFTQSIRGNMNITFSWSHNAEGYTPVSKSDLLNQDGVSLLDCVLMDSGGRHYLDSIPWLNEGIKRIRSVATGALESSDWGRETWGVEFRNNKAKIYSLHDEEYFQTISLEGFSKVLQEWMAFIQSQPDDRDSEVLSLSIDG